MAEAWRHTQHGMHGSLRGTGCRGDKRARWEGAREPGDQGVGGENAHWQHGAPQDSMRSDSGKGEPTWKQAPGRQQSAVGFCH